MSDPVILLVDDVKLTNERLIVNPKLETQFS
jgi:hypothetical protein